MPTIAVLYFIDQFGIAIMLYDYNYPVRNQLHLSPTVDSDNYINYVTISLLSSK